ncbi:MAG: LytTR family DNA-binding domain-containing protein [Bacteroidota bacterium]
MSNYLLANKKQTIFILIAILLVCIFFEALQQQYYITHFNLAENISFWDLLSSQSYRWIIWMVFALAIVQFQQMKRLDQLPVSRLVLTYSLFILALVGLNVLVISLIQWFLYDENLSVYNLFSEFIPFFTFQKAPIFTLGYIAITFILHLDKINEKLTIEIKELYDLKQEDQKNYEKLKAQMSESASILKIKIGNKHKVIAVDNIHYIEADDYCVKIFSKENRPYTMRTTLKKLESKLPPHFFRIHRKYLVNMASVKEFLSTPNHIVVMYDDTPLPVAKTRVKDLKMQFVETA